MDDDRLIDEFVALVNAGRREPVWEEEAPPSVRGEQTDQHGDYFDWQIRPCADVDWIVPLEQRLGFTLPKLYRSVVSRYIFPSFHHPSLFLYGNTPEGTDHWEFRNRLFLDETLSRVLLANRYLQFANPYPNNYDPLCFDMNRPTDNGDYPIVVVNHTQILCFDTLDVLLEMSPSFGDMIRRILDGQVFSWETDEWTG